MIERRRDPADRRAWRLYLSDKSRPLLEQLRMIAEEVLAQATGTIPLSHTEAMRVTLAAMRANLAQPAPALETAHG